MQNIAAPLLLCCVVATKVADHICISNTNFVCAFNDYPLLPPIAPRKFWNYTAFDIMTEIDEGIQHDPIVSSSLMVSDMAWNVVDIAIKIDKGM